jgi:hypothetical protein
MPCKCNSGEELDISQVIEENPPTGEKIPRQNGRG